jgi:drug/metabolite transporter (DMT)-like permease
MFWLFPASLMLVFEIISGLYFSKKGIVEYSAIQRAFAMTFGSWLIAIPYLAYTGIPVIQPRFWVIVSIHAFLLTAARILSMRAIALAPISKVLPVMQFQLIFLLVTNPLMTNDVVRPLGWLGVLITAAGVYAAQFPKKDGEHASDLLTPFKEIWKPGTREMLGVTIIFSVTSNLDKLAIQASNGPFFLVIIYGFMCVLFTSLLRYRSKGSMPAFKKSVAEALQPKMVAGGLLQGITIIGQVVSLVLAPVPFVIAFKQLSVGAGSLWGLWVRKDRRIPWYGLVGIFISVIGAIIIALNK